MNTLAIYPSGNVIQLNWSSLPLFLLLQNLCHQNLLEIDFHPSEDISSSAAFGSIQTVLICMANPQMALPQIDQGKFNTDYIKSGQGLWLMVEANFPGTGVIHANLLNT